MKSIRNLVIGSALLALLGSFVFGRDLVGYVKTSARSVQKAVKREVPLEFQVEHARQMVSDLIPEIGDHMQRIAESQVEVERFRAEVARRQDELAKQEQAIMTLRRDLKTGKSSFVYASHTYTSEEVQSDLKNRFDRFKSASEALARDRKILSHREGALRSAEEQLDKMLIAKKDLEVKVEEAESRLQSLKAIEAADMNPTIAIDDSKLSHAKEVVAALDQELLIRVKLLDNKGKFSGVIPVDTEPQPIAIDVTAEIDAYFDGQKDTEEETVTSNGEVAESSL